MSKTIYVSEQIIDTPSKNDLLKIGSDQEIDEVVRFESLVSSNYDATNGVKIGSVAGVNMYAPKYGEESSGLDIQTDKELTIRSNGSLTISPDAGYDALSSVDLIIDVQSSSNLTTKTINSNGTYQPPTGYDGFRSVSVNVPASAVTSGTKEINTISAVDVTEYKEAKVKPDNIIPDNIRKDISILGVTGTYEGTGGIVPTGNLSIIHNGDNINVAEYATVSVSVPTEGSAPNMGTKTVTPTEDQMVVNAGPEYDGLIQVTVNPIPSSYRSLHDGTQEITSTTAVPTTHKNVQVSDGNLKSSNIKSGVRILGIDGSYAGSSYSSEEKRVTPSIIEQVVTPSSGYNGLSKVIVDAIPSYYKQLDDGTQEITTTDTTEVTNKYVRVVDEDLVPENIIKNVSILGVTGTYECKHESRTVTPTESEQVVTPSSGYNGLSSVTVSSIPSNYKSLNDGVQTLNDLSEHDTENKKVQVNTTNITANNIKSGVSILGVTGTYSGGSATSEFIAKGHTYKSSNSINFWEQEDSSGKYVLDDPNQRSCYFKDGFAVLPSSGTNCKIYPEYIGDDYLMIVVYNSSSGTLQAGKIMDFDATSTLDKLHEIDGTEITENKKLMYPLSSLEMVNNMYVFFRPYNSSYRQVLYSSLSTTSGYDSLLIKGSTSFTGRLPCSASNKDNSRVKLYKISKEVYDSAMKIMENSYQF